MRVLLSVAIVFVLAFILRPANAESQPSLPSKLVEQMERLPVKLQELENRIDLIELAKQSQDAEIDELDAKVEAITSSVAELNKPVVKVEPPKPTPAPVVKVETPRVSVAVGGLLGTYNQPDGYKSQWTYPGDIATHVSTVHGISVAGKTKEQLEREHDAAHNGTRASVATQSVVVSRPLVQRSVTRSVTSNCPGGVCPTRTSVQVQLRRPLLFWRR